MQDPQQQPQPVENNAVVVVKEPQEAPQAVSQKTLMRRVVIGVSVLTMVVLLIVSPLFLGIAQEKRQKADERGIDCQREEQCSEHSTSGNAPCEKEQCIMAASRMQTSLSPSTDPCANFYEFACGGWSERSAGVAPSFNTLQRHVDQEIQILLSREAAELSGPFEKLGQFYSSCLHSRKQRMTTSPMFRLLDDLGGYKSSEKWEAGSGVTSLIAALFKVNGAPIFDLYVDSDPALRSRLAVFLDLPQRAGHFSRLFLPRRFWWPIWESELHRDNRARRESGQSREFNYMKASAEEKRLLSMERLVHMFLPETLTSNERAAEAQRILLFASMLSKIFPREKEVMSRLQFRHSILSYNVSQLQNRFGFVQWKDLMENIFSTNFSSSSMLYVLAPHYMERLTEMMKKFDKRVVHNALLLLYARDTLHELVNVTATADWKSYCARITTNVFSGAVSALYVRHYSEDFLSSLKDRVTRLFERLKETLEHRITVNAWLDEESRASALTKLSSLRGHFFTWPHFWNESFVESLMNDVDVRDDDFFNNVIRRYRQLRMFNASLDEHHPYERRWAYPFIVNAFYELSINSIVIPLAVLTQPYFQPEMPRYIPYGTMGLIFTHEILHAFDLTGAQFDGQGEREAWLTTESMQALEERLECVAQQYSSTFSRQVQFLGSNVDVQFDWNVTRNENMADISGLHVAYEAWRAEQLKVGHRDPRLPDIDLTPEQLFFVSAAQTYCSYLSPEDYIMLVEMDFHTPFPERVNGIMMNSAEFADAFHCPAGSFMNPPEKCSTW